MHNHHIIKGLFTQVNVFTWYIMSSLQQKITSHIKMQKNTEETQQASEPNSDMAGMLDWTDQEFKTTMIKATMTTMIMIRGLVAK